jgi:hypothetical protein
VLFCLFSVGEAEDLKEGILMYPIAMGFLAILTLTILVDTWVGSLFWTECLNGCYCRTDNLKRPPSFKPLLNHSDLMFKMFIGICSISSIVSLVLPLYPLEIKPLAVLHGNVPGCCLSACKQGPSSRLRWK